MVGGRIKTVKNIIFVCSGNTCRSPMGKVILEERLKTGGLEKKYIVDSAAYGEPGGDTAHPYARLAIKEKYGKDLLADHVPRKLTGKMADEADLILVMEDYMTAGLPKEKVVVLDIPDPFSASLKEYGAAAVALIKCVESLIQKIAGIDVS
jgi:protein-tyrosine-phosphatase